MTTPLSQTQLKHMADIAMRAPQDEKKVPFQQKVLQGSIAASLVGVVALTSAYYSSPVSTTNDNYDILDLVVYESLEDITLY